MSVSKFNIKNYQQLTNKENIIGTIPSSIPSSVLDLKNIPVLHKVEKKKGGGHW